MEFIRKWRNSKKVFIKINVINKLIYISIGGLRNISLFEGKYSGKVTSRKKLQNDNINYVEDNLEINEDQDEEEYDDIFEHSSAEEENSLLENNQEKNNETKQEEKDSITVKKYYYSFFYN